MPKGNQDKINANTRLRRFMFTKHKKLDNFHELMNHHFKNDDTPLRYLRYQVERTYESVTDNDKHVQGMCVLTDQTRLGSYKDKKKSGLKKIFEDESLHVDYMNGTLEEAQAYVGKTYNRCKIHHDPKRTPCRCSFTDLNNFSQCKYCDIECCSKRTLARYDEDNSGPFEFGDLKTVKTSNKNGSNQYSDLLELAVEEHEISFNIARDLKGGKTKEQIFYKYSESLPLCNMT
ncbi:MAG TPA: hypothetical protein VIY08_11550 [Candidatus Nitrosocosmicus sp.]